MSPTSASRPLPGPGAADAGPDATWRFTLDGGPAEVRVAGGTRLLDVLRYELGRTGTKEGCGEGECGACSVLVDGDLVNSCLVPVCQVAGRDVRTVEGLAASGALDPLQQAFHELGAVQCGFCTPGMLLAGQAFLASGAAPTDAAIREAIAGNLCRCTGYTKVVEAIGAVDGGAAASPSSGLASPVAPAPVAVPAATRPGVEPGTDRRDGPAVLEPADLEEALRLLATTTARPIAGGTDVMVGLAAGAIQPDAPLLDLWSLADLRGIRVTDGALEIGALTTYAELRRSPVVRDQLPVLAVAAATVGAVQVQNRGTLGGNVANASPAGDMLPILLATDAELVLASVRGTRTVAAADFWTGYRSTACAPDELVLRVRIPLVEGRHVRFRKVGTRQAQAISRVVLAVSWRRVGAAWRDVRVALGSVAEVPLRALRTEVALEGRRPDRDAAERAIAALAADIRPIDDVRGSAAYRNAVAGRILRRIILDAGAGPT